MSRLRRVVRVAGSISDTCKFCESRERPGNKVSQLVRRSRDEGDRLDRARYWEIAKWNLPFRSGVVPLSRGGNKCNGKCSVTGCS